MKIVSYHNKVFRFIAAVCGSIYILLYDRPQDFFLALVSPGFYFALLISFISAILMITAIHHVTIWLDTWCDWRKNFWVRSMLQTCLGVLAPSFIDIVIITVFFLTRGRNILYTGFFKSDFWVVLILLFFLNCYYGAYYWLQTSKKLKMGTPDVNSKSEILLEGEYKGQSFSYQVSKEILFFYKDEKFVRFVTIDGNDIPLAATIESLIYKYAEFGICQISRGIMINCRIILRYEVQKRGVTLLIVIKEKYMSIVKRFGHGDFIVTNKFIEGFKQQFNNNKEDL